MKPIYVVDNDALIHLSKLPIRAFPTAWNLMESLGTQGRLKICKAVWEEYDDIEVKPWFEARKDLFYQDYTIGQVDCLGAIGEYCKSFVDSAKPGKDADQPLVALAMSVNDAVAKCFASGPAVVVTHEKPTPPEKILKGQHKVKIPDACGLFDITVMNLWDLFETEGPI